MDQPRYLVAHAHAHTIELLWKHLPTTHSNYFFVNVELRTVIQLERQGQDLLDTHISFRGTVESRGRDEKGLVSD